MPNSIKFKGILIVTLLPALLLYSIFVIIPIFWSAYYGFFDWSGISESTFIVLDNYKEALTSSIFWTSFKNNLILVVASVFGQIPIALVFALLLRINYMMYRFVRFAIFFTIVVSIVVVGLICGYIYHPQIG